jgi:hypothetical protein
MPDAGPAPFDRTTGTGVGEIMINRNIVSI